MRCGCWERRSGAARLTDHSHFSRAPAINIPEGWRRDRTQTHTGMERSVRRAEVCMFGCWRRATAAILFYGKVMQSHILGRPTGQCISLLPYIGGCFFIPECSHQHKRSMSCLCEYECVSMPVYLAPAPSACGRCVDLMRVRVETAGVQMFMKETGN